MARPPQPLPLKVLKGRGNGKDNMGYTIPAAPAFERGAPQPPDWLPAEARALWDRVVPSLDRLDLLKDGDREAFTAYCLTWARLVDAQKRVNAKGLVYTSPGGVQHINPAVKVVEQASLVLLRFAGQFGLTPAAEVALAKPPKNDTSEDPFGAPVAESG